MRQQCDPRNLVKEAHLAHDLIDRERTPKRKFQLDKRYRIRKSPPNKMRADRPADAHKPANVANNRTPVVHMDSGIRDSVLGQPSLPR